MEVRQHGVWLLAKNVSQLSVRFFKLDFCFVLFGSKAGTHSPTTISSTSFMSR